jgi:type III secretion protein Q
MDIENQIKMKIVFELGTILISINDLKSINNGYVFDLAKEESNPISLVSNGITLGHGELVKVGNRLGVRVVKLNK